VPILLTPLKLNKSQHKFNLPNFFEDEFLKTSTNIQQKLLILPDFFLGSEFLKSSTNHNLNYYTQFLLVVSLQAQQIPTQMILPSFYSLLKRPTLPGQIILIFL
jgi:hypothetical protein